MRKLICIIVLLIPFALFAQTEKDSTIENTVLDSLYIIEVEDAAEPQKVLHAEPLYIDLIRDLGARKGEKEWNVGFGITDKYKYDSYHALVEYEWAPVNRLGLEIELPFTLYSRTTTGEKLPGNKLDGLKTAIQYTFFVSESISTSMALGYINELQFSPFVQMKSSRLVTGNAYNPFFVAAKRWGNNFHTLLYTGPVFERDFATKETEHVYQINSNFHYMISGTRNFLGLEVNQEVVHNQLQTVLRPQMRLGIMDNLMMGIVAGIPLNRQNERLSSFARLIYEPGHNVAAKHYKKVKRIH